MTSVPSERDTQDNPPPHQTPAKPGRELGLLRGKLPVPEDFDEELPEEILAEFDGR